VLLKDFKPIIGMTMGDPAGIGPEIVAKVLFLRRTYSICHPLVIGDAGVMAWAADVAKVKLEIHKVKAIREAVFEHGIVDVFDLSNVRLDEVKVGEISRKAGKAAVEYVEKAAELALSGKIHGIATAPLNKEAINLAGYNYAGHTEILADLTKTKEYTMMLIAEPLRIVHVTTHISLRKACELITKERVFKTIKLAHDALVDMHFDKPKIAISGLNPHAGEGGLFGVEEIEEIIPTIELAKKGEIDVTGPISSDTVFVRANKGEFDVVVAMYHDQGHIPVKMIGFERGVNLTVGLPIIRTSVDHGTAFDIAGKGIADSRSMEEAVKIAVSIAESKFGKII
jgi:4-hydroxythreonine-4-phosphate dehydrogenase